MVCTSAFYRASEHLLSKTFGRRFQSVNDAQDGIIDRDDMNEKKEKNKQ